jgi:hypothetical protein
LFTVILLVLSSRIYLMFMFCRRGGVANILGKQPTTAMFYLWVNGSHGLE